MDVDSKTICGNFVTSKNSVFHILLDGCAILFTFVRIHDAHTRAGKISLMEECVRSFASIAAQPSTF